MTANPLRRHLPFLFGAFAVVIVLASVAAWLGFAHLVSAAVLVLGAALLAGVVLALAGLVRIRSTIRWQAAVDAYADREIARSRRGSRS